MTANDGPRPNPYVGPRAFERGEALYGRDREIMDILDLIIAERLVLLHSPSGAGKTSLIQAALIPELEKEGFRVLRPTRVGLEPPALPAGSPANRYILSLLLSLEEGLPAEQQVPLADLARQSICDYLDGRLDPETRGQNLVLILDQFEEILTADPTDRTGKIEFFTQLGIALRDRHRWALFAMREEFVASLAPYVGLLPTSLATTYRLDVLGPEAAKLAVGRPALAAGMRFTEAATTRLVDDLRRVKLQQPDGTSIEQLGLSVEPVQLQVVCRRLWERLPAGTTEITGADIEARGDVTSALAGYYADQVATIAAATGIAERDIRDWVDRRLITEQGIRGQVLQGVDQSESLPNRAIWALVDTHLVRAEKRRGATWFELAHDRLIEPLRADNLDWRDKNLDPLERQAALWDRQGRPDALLLTGPALARARREGAGSRLDGLEKEFWAESLKAGRLQAAKRLRIVAIAATLLMAVFVALTAWALVNEHKAVVAHETSEAASTAAISARDTADAAKALSELRRVTAESESTRLAAALIQVTALHSQDNATAAAVREATRQAVATEEAYLAGVLTGQAQTAAVTPTETPGPTQSATAGPTPQPSRPAAASPTPRPNQSATAGAVAAAATARAAETQLAGLKATQAAIGRCAFEPQGEFNAYWQAYSKRLGCPQNANPSAGYFAEQPFERGQMFWSQSPELYVVAIGGDQGQWYLFTAGDAKSWPLNPSGPACAPDAAKGPDQIQPVRGFGGLWCIDHKIQRDIGFATANEQGVNGDLLQQFDRGLIIRDSRGEVYVFFQDNSTYVRQTMVWVKGGVLSMGSPAGQGEDDEHPRRPVTIQAFWLDRYEVTNVDYRACVAAGACKAPHRADGTLQVNSQTVANYTQNAAHNLFPVIFVDWNDARTYCGWKGYRLPTEAEWEWAATNLGTTLYPWGDQEPTPARANYAGKDTTRTGSYAPGPLGLYDMAGNVWEWTSSLYVPYPYRAADGREDARAAGKRVLRGGSWVDAAANLRAANRDAGIESGDAVGMVGFRCARSGP